MDSTTDVLDFGCGTGLLGMHFCGLAGSVTFADTSRGMLDQVEAKLSGAGRAGGRTLLWGAEDAGDYDLIVSLMVLHHIEDHGAAIADLARRVRAGGYLCLADLVTEDGSFHTDEAVPHNGFDRQEIEDLLRAQGMVVVRSSTGFVNRKVVTGQEREYPVFLVIARRA